MSSPAFIGGMLADLQSEVSAVVENQDVPYQEVLDSIRSQIDSTSEYACIGSLSAPRCPFFLIFISHFGVVAVVVFRNIATVKGSQSFFRKSLEKLHSSHKCPLCMRGFEEQESLDSTIRLVGVDGWAGFASYHLSGGFVIPWVGLNIIVRLVGGAE